MMEKRAFAQGMRRANKAEERRNTRQAKSGGRSGRGGGGYKGSGSGYQQDIFPSLEPSVERPGEIKFHATNEQKMREMENCTPQQPSKAFDAAGKNGNNKKNDDDDIEDKEEGGGVPVPVLDKKMAARLAAMDADEADYFCF